jgi:hypothetical protein
MGWGRDTANLLGRANVRQNSLAMRSTPHWPPRISPINNQFENGGLKTNSKSVGWSTFSDDAA